MTAVDVIRQSIKNREQVITIYGSFNGEQINQMIEEAFQDVDDGSFPNGIDTNSTFNSTKAMIVIDYHDGRPVPTPSFNEERKPTPKPEPKPTPSQPKEKKSGGLFGLFGRMFHQEEKKPEPNSKPIPKTQQKSEKTLQFADESIPSDINATKTIMDVGQGSFIDEININQAASFMLDTSDYNRANEILQKEAELYISNSEGACNLSMSGRTHHGMSTFFLDFELGMSKEVFYDHLSKGRKAAAPTMHRLTHGGDMPPVMKVYLAYAYFQKYVKYATEYVATMHGKPNGNFHMAYGPLMLKKGVCEGYSWALIHLLKTIQIPAVLVVGSRGPGSHHAWVKAQIDGQTYNIDPTISSSNFISLAGFLKSDQSMKSKGYREKGKYPAATTTTYDNGANVISFLQKERENAIRKGGDRAILDMTIQGG